MKFGKLDDISRVDFSLPPDDERTHQVLQTLEDTGEFEAYVGCPMWGNRAWIGKIYPKGAKPGDFLRLYSHSFNTIEMNTTHYRIPTIEQVQTWKSQALSHFRFCPKIPQSISHYSKLRNAEEQTQLFCDAISFMEEQLGCCFLQIHDSFGPALFPQFAAYIQSFPKAIPLAVEFRHPDWFDHHSLIPEVRALLEAENVATVITDVAGRRDVLHQSLTNGTAMIRLVGNGLVPTDYTRVDAWINRLEQWVAQGLKRVYLFMHEPDDTFAPDIGTYAIEQLNQRFSLDLPLPGIPKDSGPQMTLF